MLKCDKKMATRRVTTHNGEVYKIVGGGREYDVYVLKEVGWLFDDWRHIGTTRSLEDAFALIRSHSGSEIKKVS